MKFEIAIPSYKRAGILRERTLTMLDGCDDAPIVVYCENDIEKYIYELSGITQPIEVTNTKGIGEKRNYITKRGYEKGLDFIVMLDDDMKYLIDGDGCRYKGESVIEIIKLGYEKAIENNLRLFGICSYTNSFYLKNNVSTNLKFIRGSFTGQVLTGDPVLVPINTMEDYYRTLEFYKRDNGILRLNYYGMCADFATVKGGLQELENRTQQEEENATLIVNHFGEKMVKKIKKKRGIDLRLNNYYKNPLQESD